MRKKSKFSWLKLSRCTALATAWIGVVLAIAWTVTILFGVPQKPAKFSITSLPRFEVSTANLGDKKVTIIFDKRTSRDYLLVETDCGVALTSLPWKE